jgi:GalNAc-alpha-(1->4)-GalNAc-alpha-(1->3)-diNAcBac-PP-undecaprenol alpha-1,4-N-acetyl-D-galactosaminyltransferase
MRLTLVISSLRRGGAERTASVLANAWAAQGHHVTLLTLTVDDKPAYPLCPAVHLRQLRVRGGTARNALHGIQRQLRTVKVLRAAIRESQPEIVVSFMDIPNVLTLLAARGSNARVIITEHIHPEHYHFGRPWEVLRRLVYHRADALVCVSKPLMHWFAPRTKVKTCVIANPLDLPPLSPAARTPNAARVIVGMGRLTQQKGFDLLIEAFFRVASRHPEWSLKILGDGELLNALRSQADRLGISSWVELAGAVADPFPVLRAADLFVFSSRYEGFGNALCEAMACGLPAISFDCPSGPSEIIRHGVDGLLVPPENVAELAAAMDRLISNPEERARLAAKALEVTDRFGLSRILPLWDQLFQDVLARRR